MMPGTSGRAVIGEHQGFRTTCGREVRIGRLALGSALRPARRVSLGIGESADHRGETWAALTTAEARQLAAALLTQAAAIECDDGSAGAAAVSSAGIQVTHASGESYVIAARGHTILVDQPAEVGGDDRAATPTELLVASLASCVAFYAGRYLVRHGLRRDGLRVAAEFAMAADRPARVGTVRLRITVPAGVPAARRDALLAVASHCTVHNTLRHAPDVDITLA